METRGEIVGDNHSLAWRTLDAQYWGVPQRRKRIALVVDFAGQRAGKILFERTGVSRYLEPSIKAWKAVARNPRGGVKTDDRMGGTPYTLKIRSGCEGGGNSTLGKRNRRVSNSGNESEVSGMTIPDIISIIVVVCALAWAWKVVERW